MRWTSTHTDTEANSTGVNYGNYGSANRGESCPVSAGSFLGSLLGGVLGGSLLGAGLMYLFDPNSGPRRRRGIAQTGYGAWEGATHAVGNTGSRWSHTAADFAGDLGSRLADVAGRAVSKPRSWFGHASDAASDMAESASHAYSRASKAASRTYDKAYDRASGWASRWTDRDADEGYSASSVGGGLAGALLCAGLGATIMYFFDPQYGRRRRAICRDKFFSYSRQAGGALCDTSRDLGNRAYGWAHEARKMVQHEGPVSDQKLVARIRSEMGRVVSHASAVRVTANDGNVVLSGPILRSEVNGLLACVHGVSGVRTVENQLDLHDQPGNIAALQGQPEQRAST